MMDNEKLFQEKLSILNEEFISFVSSAIKENPSYDLSPSVRDYLNHVKDLDKAYCKPVKRKKLIAKRKAPKDEAEPLMKKAHMSITLSSSNAAAGFTSANNGQPKNQSFANNEQPKNQSVVKISLAPTPPQATTKDENEDLPPPKVDAIKHDEPDAKFTIKCSVFNFVNGEYKKSGIAYLFIKKTSDGTQLLIRAATALGSVLVNTYINDNFKAVKKAKDKIQFSYPSSEGPKTHLIRVIDNFDKCFGYLAGQIKE